MVDAQQAGDAVEQTAEARRVAPAPAVCQLIGEYRRHRLIGKACCDFVGTPEGVQDAAGQTPGNTRLVLVAGNAHWYDLAQAIEVRTVDLEQFAAPDRAVGRDLAAIERQRKDRRVDMVFCEHGGDVRVMVVHAEHRDAALARHFGGKTAGVRILVQVVRDERRRNLEHLEQMKDRFLEEGAGGGVRQLADVLRDKGFLPACDAHGVLHLPADGEDRRPGMRQFDRARRVAAAASDDLQTTQSGQRDAVVAASDYVAVMDQEGVGNAGQALQGFDIVGRRRLAARVAARHQERERLCLVEPLGAGGTSRRFMEQQVMQRRHRQHGAEPGQPGGNVRHVAVAA